MGAVLILQFDTGNVVGFFHHRIAGWVESLTSDVSVGTYRQAIFVCIK